MFSESVVHEKRYLVLLCMYHRVVSLLSASILVHRLGAFFLQSDPLACLLARLVSDSSSSHFPWLNMFCFVTYSNVAVCRMNYVVYSHRLSILSLFAITAHMEISTCCVNLFWFQVSCPNLTLPWLCFALFLNNTKRLKRVWLIASPLLLIW